MKLEELFAAILAVPESELSEQASPASIMAWDSLGHINLIAGMEETYNVAFSTDEILAVHSLGDARRLLRAKGVAA